MPTAMASRGALYSFSPPQIVGVNGAGEAVMAGGGSLTWGWTYISDAEAVYLFTTVLGGEASQKGGITVYNHLKTLTAYTSATIFRPTYETFRNGVYMNVVLRIEGIE